MRSPPTGVVIRSAVVLAILGLLLLLPSLFAIRAWTVGLFMFGTLLLTLGIVLYMVVVVRDLRRREVL